MKTFQDFGIDISTTRKGGKLKMLCPKCHDTRSNKRDKSLSVDVDKGVWHCHYCSWSGTLHVGQKTSLPTEREYKRPAPRPYSSLSPKVLAWFNGRGIASWVLERVKVTEGEHFMPQANQKMHTVQFNYYLNEELVNVKYRTGNKLFMLESGAELIPYNINGILGKEECIITEGEMDCLSFIQIGKENCISVPNGANSNLSYLDAFIKGWFDDKSTIYIAVDTDAKGIQLRNELIRRFGSERCRIITYGDDCKDANDHLIKYGAESLEACFKNAKDVDVEGIFTLDDYEDGLDSLYARGAEKGYNIGHINFDKLCSFEMGRLAIVTGVPGSGKSEFIDEICVRMNIMHEFKVGFFSPENMPLQYHAMKLLEKLCGKRFCGAVSSPKNITQAQYEAAKQYYRENFFHVLPEKECTIDTILAKAKHLVKRHGIRIFAIDPYNRIESEQDSRETETQYISRVLDRISTFARLNNVLVFLMAHPTKVKKDNGNGGIPTMYDINGSANFFNKTDYGIIVHRFRGEQLPSDDSEQEEHFDGIDRTGNDAYTLVRVAKVKFRHLGKLGDAKFKYNPINGRYIPWEENSPPINFYANLDDLIYDKVHGGIKQCTFPTNKFEMPFEPCNDAPF